MNLISHRCSAPDNEASWKMQMKPGVDLIGTNQINELAGFSKSRQKKITLFYNRKPLSKEFTSQIFSETIVQNFYSALPI